ncbi:hypothetical protein TorRG33x02_331770 [Trema orientale]|uniref:Uncharacterized protein n=1 Tax=Trema orientale TaxID=63057 RepID=A0A2P5B5T9_TREOI|nr:hypothetical protein TorRG33x02_331770 [Trema orientale]
MAEHKDDDGVGVVISNSDTSSSTRIVLRDIGLWDGEEPKVIITQFWHWVLAPIDLDHPKVKASQVRHRVPASIDLDLLGAKASQDALEASSPSPNVPRVDRKGKDETWTSGYETDNSFLADSDGKFGADRFASIVTLRMLNWN